MRATSGTVTFFDSMRKRPPRTGGPGGRWKVRWAKVGPGIPVHAGSGSGRQALSFSRAVSCFPSRSVPIPARDGSGSLPGSKRNVVLYPLFCGPHLLDQVGEIAAVLDEVDVRAVNHEERSLHIVMEILPERLRQALQILWSDSPLEVPVTFAEPPEQDVGAGLQVDDQIRAREPLVEQLEDLPVELELVGAERDGREDRVLGEEVVSDRAAAEQLALPELALLPVALEQEEELGLEGMAFGLVVELPEEGILLDRFEEEPRPELGGKPSREGRLPDADGALDRDVPPRGPVRRHPRLRGGPYHCPRAVSIEIRRPRARRLPRSDRRGSAHARA